jgi:phosphatidate cytidylyltransferase
VITASSHGRDPHDPAPDDGASARRSPGRNLPVAIASGLALAGVAVGALYVEQLVFLGLIMALEAVALHELHTALRGAGLRPATPVVAGAGIVMLFGAYLHGPSALAVGLVLAVAGAVLWAMVVDRLDRRRAAGRGATEHAAGALPGQPGLLGDVAATVLMTCWVPLMAGFIGLLLDRPGGEWYLLATLALPVSNDIGAYGVGSQFGRRLLAPSVSPGKTCEGLAGGLATVVVLAVAVTSRGADFTILIAVCVGLAVVAASTLGDLTESLLKRDLGVKDLGAVMPGHGGIMDRIDGILFSLPTAHLVLALFGL